MAKKRRRQDGNSHTFAAGNEQLRTLCAISQSLYQYINIDDLILYIIHQIKGLMNVEGVSVILHDETADEFVFRWAEDDPSEVVTKLKETRFPVHHGIAGSVFKSGTPELIVDVDKDPRHYKKIDGITKFITKSMISVPLRKKEKTIGVLEVLNKKKGFFDDKDITFLSTLAPVIAMALDNARMYAELDRAYKELQVVDKGKDDLIQQTRNEIALLQREVRGRYRFDKIIGNSEPMIQLFKLCEKVIDSDITVLIEGETGTGKELIARTIHYNGPRKDKPFVTQNCGGIPDPLLASELFGHKKGAYTGAFRDGKGLFEVADGGTVFLDEVGEMSPAMQTNLLRVLQEGEIKALGSERSKKVDVRLISATNKNLEDEARKERLREDLFYRISVFTIKLPPLRERTGDIPLLANHFVRKFGKKAQKPIKGLNQEALECLTKYPFPGNVRELENEIERAMAMVVDNSIIGISNLSEKIRCRSITASPEVKLQGSLKEMVEELEKSVLIRTLEKHGGNKTKVAEELGLSRNGLMKKMNRYRL
ncbi:MAG: sigma-54-dependent Fis family transcriptional regulator [Planctomycetota bacterium]|jgi:Nif-specific regulatory protein